MPARPLLASVLTLMLAACAAIASASPPTLPQERLGVTVPTDEPPHLPAPTTTTTTAHTTTTTTSPPPPPPAPVVRQEATPSPEESSPGGCDGYGDPALDACWDRLAGCESGGNWAINTGNGYYGGLQFALSSWRAVGGTGYPHEHPRAEQIRRARLLHASGGWQHWPGCSRSFGWL